MQEETQPQGEVVATEDEISLDDVISEYSVKEVPQAPPVQVAPDTNSAVPRLPDRVDPLDEQSFNSYAQAVNQGQSVLSTQLSEVKSELTQLRQERAELQIEADINSAVQAINEGNDLDPELVRVHLEYTAQKKPGFKDLWDNRKTNPKAYEKALKALSREVGQRYSVRQDPELTANQKAVQQSQRSMATKATSEGSGNSIEDRLAAAKNPGEWQRIWREYANGGQ